MAISVLVQLCFFRALLFSTVFILKKWQVAKFMVNIKSCKGTWMYNKQLVEVI